MKLVIKKLSGARGLFFAMLGLIIVLMGLTAAAVVFGNRLLQRKTDQLISLKLDSRTLDEQQKALIQAKKDLARYADLEKTAQAVVPQEKDQARTVREIIKLAEESGITVSGISFPSSNLGQTSTKPTTTTTPSSTPSTAPKTTTPPTTQVKPVEGISGVYQLEVVVQTDANQPIPYQNLLSFLGRLEQNRRTSHVTNITIQPNAKNRNNVTFNLTLNVYIKP